MTPSLSRRGLLVGAAAVATSVAVGQPAFASERARESRPGEYIDVQLLNITDLHGNLATPTSAADGFIPGPDGQDTVNVGGVAFLKTHLDMLRQKRNSIFFSVGDNYCGGEPLATKLLRDESAVEALNALGVQFSTLGNHELDYGVDYLIEHVIKGRPVGVVGRDDTFIDSTGRRFHGLNFPYYTANIIDRKSRRLVFKPYNVEWVSGPNGRRYPIGFIHLTLNGTPTGSSSYNPKLDSLVEIDQANYYAKYLKSRGVRALVISVHDGAQQVDNWHAPINGGNMSTGPALDLAAKVDGDIAAIITGHWHWWFNAMLPGPDGRLRPVVEASHAGQMINEVLLKLDPATGEVVRDLTVSTNHAVTLDVTPDPKLQKIVDYWAAAGTARYNLPAGRITADFTPTLNANGESTMGDLGADFMYWYAAQYKDGHPDFALVAAKPITGSNAVAGKFLYAKDTTHPADQDGLILLGEAYQQLGYENPVLTVSLPGSAIKAALEQQWQTQTGGTVKYGPLNFSDNVRATFDTTKPVGQRVDPARFLIDGKPLDITRTYRVTGLAYTLIGADGYAALIVFTDPFRNGNIGDRDHEGFVRYLRAHPVISPSKQDRITVLA